MIIETRDDVVRLSGSLHKNQWITIKAAVKLLLRDNPNGVIIDCGQLEEISEDGAKTFLEAMRDIEAAGTRIVVANVSDEIIAVCRTVPGVRSQLPIAGTVEEARASLRMHNNASVPPSATSAQKSGSVIVVPLVAGIDLTYGAALAGRLARSGRSEVRLIYFMEVTRTLPLNAPLLEAETAARCTLDQAAQYARQQNTTAVERVERVREAGEGILAALRSSGAELVVVGATSEPVGADGHDRFHQLVDILLHRAPCEVVIGRMRPQE